VKFLFHFLPIHIYSQVTDIPHHKTQVSSEQFLTVLSVLTPPLLYCKGICSKQLRDQEDCNWGFPGPHAADHQRRTTQTSFGCGLALHVLPAVAVVLMYLHNSSGKTRKSIAASIWSDKADQTVDLRTYYTFCFLRATGRGRRHSWPSNTTIRWQHSKRSDWSLICWIAPEHKSPCLLVNKPQPDDSTHGDTIYEAFAWRQMWISLVWMVSVLWSSALILFQPLVCCHVVITCSITANLYIWQIPMSTETCGLNGFKRTLQLNVRIMGKIGNGRLLHNPFQFTQGVDGSSNRINTDNRWRSVADIKGILYTRNNSCSYK
jgi:hypothetical protein